MLVLFCDYLVFLPQPKQFVAMKRTVKFVLWMALLALVCCKKEPQEQENVPVVKIHEDEIVVTRNNVKLVAEVMESIGLDVIERGFVYGIGGCFQDTVFCDNDSICFSAEIIGLQENTTYCYKAFARNAQGMGWSESSSFVTDDFDLPFVEIVRVVVNTSICVYCTVTNDGGLPISGRGVCWSTTPEPTVDDNQVVGNVIASGGFRCDLDVFDATTYYVRPYATNSKGLAYGEQREICVDWLEKPFTVNGVNFKMIMVQGGTISMGAQRNDPNGKNYDEDAYEDEGPVHDVSINTFFIGETEVSQQLWKAVVGNNPSYWPSQGLDRPVEQVSWDDVVDVFLPKLNAMTEQEFRLPTEAEWEFAARGGEKSNDNKYSGSNDVYEVACFVENSHKRPSSVHSSKPNELQLHRMSGNVWEWCSDWYGDYENSPSSNPQGPSSGRYRVLRGGSYLTGADLCRTTSRNCNSPGYRNCAVGFRLALSVNNNH